MFMAMDVTGIMKFFAILFSCAIVAGIKNEIEDTSCSGSFLKGVVSNCTAAHGASQADIEDYIYLRSAASEGAKCFRACIFGACGAFNDDGTLKSDTAKRSAYLVSRLDESKWSIAEKAATYCLQRLQIGNDRCEITEAYIRCLTANSKVELNLLGGV